MSDVLGATRTGKEGQHFYRYIEGLFGIGGHDEQRQLEGETVKRDRIYSKEVEDDLDNNYESSLPDFSINTPPPSEVIVSPVAVDVVEVLKEVRRFIQRVFSERGSSLNDDAMWIKFESVLTQLSTPPSAEDLQKEAEEWWYREGKFIDPEPSVDWFYKRNNLAEISYLAGRKVGMNQ